MPTSFRFLFFYDCALGEQAGGFVDLGFYPQPLVTAPCAVYVLLVGVREQALSSLRSVLQRRNTIHGSVKWDAMSEPWSVLLAAR